MFVVVLKTVFVFSTIRAFGSSVSCAVDLRFSLSPAFSLVSISFRVDDGNSGFVSGKPCGLDSRFSRATSRPYLEPYLLNREPYCFWLCEFCSCGQWRELTSRPARRRHRQARLGVSVQPGAQHPCIQLNVVSEPTHLALLLIHSELAFHMLVAR